MKHISRILGLFSVIISFCTAQTAFCPIDGSGPGTSQPDMTPSSSSSSSSTSSSVTGTTLTPSRPASPEPTSSTTIVPAPQTPPCTPPQASKRHAFGFTSPQRSPTLQGVFTRNTEKFLTFTPESRSALVQEAWWFTPFLRNLYLEQYPTRDPQNITPLRSVKTQKKRKENCAYELTADEVFELFQKNAENIGWEPHIYQEDRAGYIIYENDDIINLNRVGSDGRTNAQRMEAGDSPLGPDGNPINLHHLTRHDPGPLVEITQFMHRHESGVFHAPVGHVGRERPEFDELRARHWQRRLKALQAQRNQTLSSSQQSGQTTTTTTTTTTLSSSLPSYSSSSSSFSSSSSTTSLSSSLYLLSSLSTHSSSHSSSSSSSLSSSSSSLSSGFFSSIGTGQSSMSGTDPNIITAGQTTSTATTTTTTTTVPVSSNTDSAVVSDSDDSNTAMMSLGFSLSLNSMAPTAPMPTPTLQTGQTPSLRHRAPSLSRFLATFSQILSANRIAL